MMFNSAENGHLTRKQWNGNTIQKGATDRWSAQMICESKNDRQKFVRNNDGGYFCVL